MNPTTHIFARVHRRTGPGGATSPVPGTEGAAAHAQAAAPTLLPEGRRISELEAKDALRHDHDHADVRNIHSLADLERRLARAQREGDELHERVCRKAIRARQWRASHDPFDGPRAA